MILYVNGDSHTAAAEAVNTCAFAEDDSQYFYMGRAPHPSNLAVSWGKMLSNVIKYTFKCDAESASSNSRIIRTTKDWLSTMPSPLDVLVIIQWSTWEREEWLIDGTYYQINASGSDDIPPSHRDQYKQYVSTVDWKEKTNQAHEEIWQFHNQLQEQGIKHIFFNGNNDFSKIQNQKDWNLCYIDPYNPDMTFDAIIRKKGIETVAPNSWHFGREGHSYFYQYVLQYCISNKFI